MRADDDLEVYVAARWPSLVRSVVERGAAPDEAAEVAADALSRCRGRWAAVSRDGDVDALVADELDAAWERHRPRRLLVDPSTEDVPVLAPPTLDDLGERVRRRRVRATRRAVAVLVPLLLVAGGVTWWTTRDDDPPADPQAVAPVSTRAATNPATVAWWADGRLHLDDVELALPALTGIAVVDDGAVVADDRGRVLLVRRDGRQRELGLKDPDTPLVADPVTGLVAWVDLGGETPTLAAYDPGLVVGLVSGPAAEGRAIRAVANDTVYLTDPLGTRAWQPGSAVSAVVEPAELVAAVGRNRAYQVDDDVLLLQRTSSVYDLYLPGIGATISEDGDVALTRLRSGQWRAYDLDTGDRLDLGVDQRLETVLAAQPGRAGEVVLVVGPAEPETAPGFVRTEPSGQLELRTCDLLTGQCVALADFPESGSPPLLAG